MSPKRIDDTTPPLITFTSPANGAVYVIGQPVVADYSCSGLSAVATCAGPVPPGGTIDTSTPGTYVFTVNATDTRGNRSTASAAYSVIDVPRIESIPNELPSTDWNRLPFTTGNGLSIGEMPFFGSPSRKVWPKSTLNGFLVVWEYPVWSGANDVAFSVSKYMPYPPLKTVFSLML